jgi:DNA polymerase elongation subunit (family B)
MTDMQPRGSSMEAEPQEDLVFQLLDIEAKDEPVDRVGAAADVILRRAGAGNDDAFFAGDDDDDGDCDSDGEYVDMGGDDDDDDDDDDMMGFGDEDDDEPGGRRRGKGRQRKKPRNHCTVHLFGKTKDGRSVYVEVRGFKPFLFVEMPEGSTERECASVARFMEERMKLGRGEVGVTLERRKRLYGWVPSLATADAPAGASTRRFPYALLTFPTSDHKRWASNIMGRGPVMVPGLWGGRTTFDVCEARVEDAHKCCDVAGFSPSTWIALRVGKTFYRPSTDPDRRSHCAMEAFYTIDAIYPCSDQAGVAPLCIASWDIECTSPSGNFPDQTNAEDRVIQIGTVHGIFGSDRPWERIVFCLGPTDPVDGVEIRCFDDEGAMIAAWRDYIVEELDADVLIGYNISRFDRRYLADRMLLFHDPEQKGSFFRWSRLKRHRTLLEQEDVSSDAYGDSENFVMHMHGRIELDLFTHVKREYKLVSYTLNHVSEHFLEDRKNDLPPKMIFKRYSEGPEGRAEVAALLRQGLRPAVAPAVETGRAAQPAGHVPRDLHLRASDPAAWTADPRLQSDRDHGPPGRVRGESHRPAPPSRLPGRHRARANARLV